MKQTNLEMYRRMYLIRKAEETIQEYYAQDRMKTPMHMSMGEEAIVAGVVQALNPEDQVLGTYRSHALYLAKTGETDLFFAEMHGKATGMAQGKSGSMHLSSPDKGLLCCSAIVASSIPIAMGAAYANKYLKNGKRVAVFFGDGATDEGVFWETVNFACLKKLPMLFVCEDNGFAVHTPRQQRHGFSSLNKVIANFDCNVFEEKSTDPAVIFETTRKALATMEQNGRPCFLRLHYYRYLEHVGINEDFEAAYRPKSEYLEWLKVDPIAMQREKLAALGFYPQQVQEVDLAIDCQIARSTDFATESAYADACELHKGVFICG
jgi:acetoin:2,6-dichlorophenolindophenol oxidoreductase subunit alpha